MKFGKNIILLMMALALVIGVLGYTSQMQSGGRTQEIAYSEFMRQVQDKRVVSANINGNNISGLTTDGQKFSTYAPYNPTTIDTLLENGVRVEAKPQDASGESLWSIFISWGPMLLLIGVWVYFFRQANSGNNKAMSFGKSRARLVENSKKVTFDDVAGADESKAELQEIVEFLKEPQKFKRLGGRIPKGVLLVGPPGTGKTLLAKAVAGEANVPFFSISGSDFVEMFVGVGASRVRDMFAQAKKNAPCLLFVDEIDAVGRHRGAGYGGGNDEREQTLNQLLVEMDGFEDNENVILIAATNRPDVLDPALLRPGRFDRQVQVTNPDVRGREAILQVHVRKVPLARDVDLSVVARGTPGFSGADLANLVNEAALLAARHNKRRVTAEDFDNAKDKVLMGTERKSMAMDEQEKRKTAYHEAGHAICALNVAEADPIHKATIIPRGRALGMVQSLPEKDSYSESRTKMLSSLTLAMGGRVSEELVYGHEKVTSGAKGDIQMATNLARAMVTEWGMSDKLGPISYASNQDNYLGISGGRNTNISEQTANLIDAEIKLLITNAYNEAKQILTEHRQDLDVLAQALIEYETLTGTEIKDILAGKKLDKTEQSPVDADKLTQSSVPEV